jgi:regulator of CtrA degradation
MGSETPTAFFNKTYDEALALMVEAKEYIAWHERDDRGRLVNLDRLRLSRETMRVTARLTQIMAWLFVQKAVVVGELTRAEAAAEPYTLSGQDVCAPDDPDHRRDLPAKMVDLLDRSHHLYVRVSRLDQLVRREAR